MEKSLEVKLVIWHRFVPLLAILFVCGVCLYFRSEIEALLSAAGEIVALTAAFALILNAVFGLMASKIRIKIGHVKAFGSVAFAISWAATFVLLLLSYALVELVISVSK